MFLQGQSSWEEEEEEIIHFLPGQTRGSEGLFLWKVAGIVCVLAWII